MIGYEIGQPIQERAWFFPETSHSLELADKRQREIIPIVEIDRENPPALKN